MAEIICPICNRPNDANAERCWFCQAVLPKEEATPINPEENWLDSFRDDSTPQNEEPTGEPTPESQPEEEEVPDWLARIRTREQEQRQQQVGEPPDFEDSNEDVPDWLREIQTGKPPASNEAAEPEPEQPKKDTSNMDNDDWLQSLANEQHPAENTPQAEETPTSTNEPIETGTVLDSPGPSLDATDADWLKEFIQEPKAEEAQTTNEPAQEEPVDQKNEPIVDTSSSEPLLPSQEEPPQSVIEDAEPDWLSDFKALNPDADLASQVIPPARPDDAVKPAFDDSTLMNWMSGKQDREEDSTIIASQPVEVPEDTENAPTPEPTPAVEAEATLPEENEAGESIAKASLPAWLQALRPAKKQEPESAQNQNPQNPLAGIEGTLLQENIEQFYTKPQTYIESLEITDVQKKRAATLQKMVQPYHWEDDEEVEKASPKTWILRLIVSLILIVAAILPSFFKGLPVTMPSLYPSEVVEMYNGLNGLVSGTPVLVAADFDGSLYGELSLSSRAVLQHLMQRNLPITSLSTTPTGATLLQTLLKESLAVETAYPQSNLVNFGYLPGGSMAMQALAVDPVSALPKDVNLTSPWQAEPLQAVKKLSDFGVVIVITENADTARFWVEQVQPSLGTTPLYVIISAQAAPLIQPYYDSKQIKGYIAGLNEGTVYESLSANPGSASASYPAFQISLLILAGLIFIAGIVVLVSPRLPSERAER